MMNHHRRRNHSFFITTSELKQDSIIFLHVVLLYFLSPLKGTYDSSLNDALELEDQPATATPLEEAK